MGIITLREIYIHMINWSLFGPGTFLECRLLNDNVITGVKRDVQDIEFIFLINQRGNPLGIFSKSHSTLPNIKFGSRAFTM